ncbi:cyclin-T isoform X2 [Lutzomyia longipalpis]|nr:cyclin-T isoform X2 [Lutzomyia longipalpis]
MMAENDKDSRWYFTAEQLQNSPSRKCGIDADKELVYRQQTAYLIQEMGQLLRVSQLCINTAIVYMHRFYAFHSFTHFNRHGIAAASLFLAAKVEEQPRKLEHVIRVYYSCLTPSAEPPDTTKEAFSEQAQDLVFNENVLLQTLGFDVAIDHPHTHVVKTCHLVKACKDLAQTSYFMASNSLHLTTMCLQYKPTVVACFCIHLACQWSNWAIPNSSEGLPWFHYVDKTVTVELLTQLTEEFIQIYDKSPSRLKSKLNSIKTLAQGAKVGEGSSQERSNHHRASSSMGHSHHHKVDPNNPKGMPSSSSSRQQQQHFQQMHHQSGKSRERPNVPPTQADGGHGGMKGNMVGTAKGAAAIQGSSGHTRGLPPPRDAFGRESSKSRPSFQQHHPSGFPQHKPPPDFREQQQQQKKDLFASSTQQSKSGGGGGQYQQSSNYFSEPPTRSGGSNTSQGMRYSQNSHKHEGGPPPVFGPKNPGGSGHVDVSQQNNESSSDIVPPTSPRHPQKSIFSPDQPEKVDVMKKSAVPSLPRYDDRRMDVKKDKRPDMSASGGGSGSSSSSSHPSKSNQVLHPPPQSLNNPPGMEKKVASVKPQMKHPPPPPFGGPPYKISSNVKRTFDDMTRHEESGIDFREAKMRRSEAENESRARAGKMDSMGGGNPLHLGGSFNAFDTAFDQPKSSSSSSGGHKIFPPSLANSIETNPDLVSCLLKESLSENKWSMGGGTEKQQQQQPPAAGTGQDMMAHVVQPPPAVQQIDGKNPTSSGGMMPSNVLQPPQQGVPVKSEVGAEAQEHHKNRSEKKKKKDKHKHKEKDKTKDREERKKHKKDKERDKGEQQRGNDDHHKNPVTLKIMLPREKGPTDGGGAAATDGGFKIKIPKERLRPEINAGGHGMHDDRMAGTQPSSLDHLLLDKPSSSLKIKISKDKIENFSDDPMYLTAYPGAPGGGGAARKKDKDKEKILKYTM